MRPALIDSMSWAMAEVYGAVTDRILVNLARHFPYIKSAGEIKGSFDYQARMLGQIGQVNRETADIILQSLGGADDALRRALNTAILDALRTEEPKLRAAAQKELLWGPGMLPPEMSANQMQAFQAYYRQSADKLNLVNTVMLESTEAAYRTTVADAAARIGRTQSILNVGTGEVVTGVSSWNQAMHDAVKKMVDNGLTGFVDHGGHRWSPEAYAAMDIRTTMFNTARAAIWERAGQYGADLYQVSSHNGARPRCYPWQGKIISRSDWTGEVEDLEGNKVHVYAQSETSYGEAAGLFGVNCKHYPMTFIPRFSSLKGTPQDPEENAQAYALSQQQRGLERKLREEKRDLAVMKAQGASEDEIKAQRERVNRASSRIDEFCDEHDLPRRRNRESAPVRATWPDENGGRVTRFNGNEYIDANAVPPLKGAVAPAKKVAPQATTQTQNVVQSEPERKPESDFVLKTLPASNIDVVPVQKLAEALTTQQIIDRIGGADQTIGSCSSLTLAYGGNKAGYDVLDFRGGASCKVFARYDSMQEIAQFKGVDGIVVSDYNGFKSANKALASVEAGKEYYFATASHAAVVRKSETGLEYLELQSAGNNGFHALNDSVLKWRFGAHKSRSLYGYQLKFLSILIDLEKLGQSTDFVAMLDYINTPANAQKKGAGGGIR